MRLTPPKWPGEGKVFGRLESPEPPSWRVGVGTQGLSGTHRGIYGMCIQEFLNNHLLDTSMNKALEQKLQDK